MTDMTLGKYRVLAEIGKGGFATVYRALDATLDREVALKVLDPILARDPVWAARFQREAKAVARLRHPHIVTIHEIGESEGRLYIATELIDGPSLAERIAESGRLPWEEALTTLGQMADALDYAHGQGVLHRDLKPANILLDPKRGAILTDFGFARLVGASSMSVSMSSTAGGNIVGTPAYIAPEVWDGEEPTSQTDLYSLGCVAYEMLTGEVLFAGKTPSVVIKKHTVDGPSFPDSAHWPTGVLNGVREVLARAIAKDPAERYANAGALTDALSALGQPMPVTNITPPGTPLHGNAPTPAPARVPTPAGARSCRRWLWPMAGAGGVALIVVLALMLRAAMGGDQTPPGAISPTAVPIAAATAMTPATPSLVVQAPATSTTPQPQTTTAGIGSTRTSPIDGMIQGYVPVGEFLMGANEDESINEPQEKPQHKVVLHAFWIDQTEVVNAMFAKFVSVTSYETDAEKAAQARVYSTNKVWEEVPGANWQHPQGPNSTILGMEQHPVVQISWNDAAAYCRWAGRRLPTEAEWEKAARGTDGRKYPWGNASPSGDLLNFADRNLDQNWADPYQDDGYQFTAPVGRYTKGVSPYGAMDMVGNAAEWVADWYAGYSVDAVLQNPSGPASGPGRVVRGGSWMDGAALTTTTYRSWNASDVALEFLGFRCAQDE